MKLKSLLPISYQNQKLFDVIEIIAIENEIPFHEIIEWDMQAHVITTHDTTYTLKNIDVDEEYKYIDEIVLNVNDENIATYSMKRTIGRVKLNEC